MTDLVAAVITEARRALFAVQYPVGCVEINTSDTDPSTMLEFGTWVKIGEVTVSPDGGVTDYTEYHWERTA